MSGFLPDLDLSANRIEEARQRIGADGYIDLTSSNPTHQGLLFPADALREAAEGYWRARRYDPHPRGLAAARQAIAGYYRAGRAGAPPVDLAPDDIFVTASTSEAYGLLFALLAEPGDNILAPDVTYPLFEYLAAIHRVELRPYRLDESRGWQIDPHSLRAQVDGRSRAILVISPHNPTGAVVQSPQPVFSELGLPVICDEVFAEFPYRAPVAPVLGGLHPALPVFTLGGISKLFALPDLKLGWIALNRPAAAQADRLELLNDTFLGASTLIQTMLPALFERGFDFVGRMRQRVRQNLDLALDRLAACPRLRVSPPDGGYYLFPEIPDCEDDEQLVIDLLARGVLVHPGYFYGCPPDARRGARIMISCLTEPDRLAEGLGRLARAVTAGNALGRA